MKYLCQIFAHCLFPINSIFIKRDLLAIVVLSFGYDARARSFFRRMAWALQVCVTRGSRIYDNGAVVYFCGGTSRVTRLVLASLSVLLQIPWAPYMRDLESELAHALYREELAVLDSQKTLKKRDPWRLVH